MLDVALGLVVLSVEFAFVVDAVLAVLGAGAVAGGHPQAAVRVMRNVFG